MHTAPIHLGSLPLASRFVLAPLAGYTQLPFRLAIRELGGLGLATTDLVNAKALLKSSRKTMELIQTCPEDRPLSVQIYGSVAQDMCAAAQWLQEYGVSAIDINMGCPVHKVVRGGGGSAMMCDTHNTVHLVRAVVESVRIPVTVKMRLGWDLSNLSAPFFAREFEQAGCAGITIHGRTREQGFSGGVHLDGIRAAVESVEKMPIFGNGDVRTVADAERMLLHTGCAGIAIGRGALLNPWIFVQFNAWHATGDPGGSATRRERLDFMARHFGLQLHYRGERFACLAFRKVANWYCRVLRPGHDLQQRLVRLGSAAEFEQIMGELRDQPGADRPESDFAFSVKTPKGPISHW